MSEETAEQVRALVAKGAMGGSLIFTTADCQKTYETLLGKGVEFTDEPTDRPYGIDCGLRDPFGNRIRFTQPKG
ncbi:glyoxalase/bleomycin resistance protein/dioxygenase superfamily protein [Streptomyces sp. DvalAA-21]|nr:glyoxalase/bleomycin resistance protein/dioxygenase superfamily protein [Streptomyces sp. DvalAA-21]RAJ41113.1 glyoxalase/bleomycin resistance protein/dioxygenase superfamily protein [Streptomyces sp. DpondAA-E10]RAJ43811.1 glyoxalase/bleomycin resistance protein/dioxygenase superfamily protein [Streptomyces sp. DpondAA-A50]SCD53768.1 Glyoxalase/Bleomycin resistance protein/Dioxygenase superfamily protein [Streptomyces sp. DpondAA-F4a]SCL86294.1 Glyoxalase/Bleomycin resistance protein/Dioxyg